MLSLNDVLGHLLSAEKVLLSFPALHEMPENDLTEKRTLDTMAFSSKLT